VQLAIAHKIAQTPPKLKRPVICNVITTLSRYFNCCNLKEEIYNHSVVSLVSALGMRRWRQRGLKHSVKHKELSSTIQCAREMTGMDKLIKVSLLRIVSKAELELPFGSRTKMVLQVW